MLNPHREKFDEEKEPDGMLLSGWTQAVAAENNTDNEASTSSASQSVSQVTEQDDEIVVMETGIEISTGKKRKLSDIATAETSVISNSGDVKRSKKDYEQPEDKVVMLDSGNGISKKRSQ